MTLPTLALPKYRTKIKSTDKPISYRPFIVREEKVLLVAMESKEYSMISDAIKHIVNECTFHKLDIDSLPVFDLTYLFLNIRAKSVGETVNPIMMCGNCNNNIPVEVDLTKIKIKTNDKHKTKIQLEGDVGCVMKYPTTNVDKENENFDKATSSIANCIEMIYSGDEVFKTSELESQEVVDFIEDLSHSNFEKLIEFFDTMPKLSYDIEYTCDKCNEKNVRVLEGLGDFFL